MRHRHRVPCAEASLEGLLEALRVELGLLVPAHSRGLCCVRDFFYVDLWAPDRDPLAHGRTRASGIGTTNRPPQSRT